MNVDLLNHAEKQVYWKAFYEQRTAIDEFRSEMFAFNPEWRHDSQGLLEATNHVFDGNFEHEFATKAVLAFQAQQRDAKTELILTDEEFAHSLQAEFDLEFARY
jgi:hypothetical protein